MAHKKLLVQSTTITTTNSAMQHSAHPERGSLPSMEGCNLEQNEVT